MGRRRVDGKNITVRVSRKMYEKIDRIVKETGEWTSIAEFARDAIKAKLAGLQLKEVMANAE